MNERITICIKYFFIYKFFAALIILIIIEIEYFTITECLIPAPLYNHLHGLIIIIFNLKLTGK